MSPPRGGVLQDGGVLQGGIPYEGGEDQQSGLLPPPHVISSKRPPILRMLLWLGFFLCATWMLCFAAFFVILWHSHTEAVLDECGSFWDIMLLCISAPPLVPLMYATASAFGTQWHNFVGCGALGLFLAALAAGVQAASSHTCTHALRASTPPLPWLLYVAWLKTIVFGSSAYSLLLHKSS